MIRALYLLFVLSGAAGLIYESIWTRYLGLFVGHDAYAQIIVLTIFLGGMSAGAMAVSRYSERLRQPLYGYLAVEFVVGVIGLFFHDIYLATTSWAYESVYPGLAGGWALTAVKWGIASALILPQSVLLGATFPLMSAGTLRLAPAQPGRTLSLLYFANSLGAAVGVLVAGFWLVSFAGLPGTLLSAAMLNLLVAVGTIFVVVRARAVAHDPVAIDSSTMSRVEESVSSVTLAAPARLLLVAAFGTAVASFIYEIGWIRMLALVLGSATHSFELMLSAFILGLALGAWWIRSRADRLPHPLRTLGIVQWVMGFLALATLPLYLQSFHWMSALLATFARTDAGYTGYTLARYGICLAVMLPATFCAGMTLPLITRILLTGGAGERAIGAVYGWNTLGSILGVMLGGLFLMPVLGLKGMLIAGAVLDMAVGVMLLWHVDWRGVAGRAVSVRWLMPAAALGAMVVTAVALGSVRMDPALLASGVFRHGTIRKPGERKVEFYSDGRTATVSVMKTEANQYLSLATNGKPDASLTSEWFKPCDSAAWRAPLHSDAATQTLVPLMTLAYAPKAKTAAIIGQGSGMSSHFLLASSNLKELVTIEIEPEMIAGSRVFYPINRRAFDDPRSRHVIEDAKSYFASEQRRYDVIVSEPSNPWVSGVSGLFTTEFYSRVRQYLTKDGIFGQWIQVYELDDGLVLSVLAALHQNFPSYQVYLVPHGDLLVVASNGRLPEPDWSVADLPSVRSDLCRFVPITPSVLDALYLTGRSELAPLLDSTSVGPNSDFYPVLDLGAERRRYRRDNASGLPALSLEWFNLLSSITQKRSGVGTQAIPSFPQNPRVRAQAVAAYLKDPSAAAAADSSMGPTLRRAEFQWQAWQAALEADRAPSSWELWVIQAGNVAKLRDGGNAGTVDEALYASTVRFMERHRAPSAARDVVAFRHGLASWDFAEASKAADRLLPMMKGDKLWMEPDEFRDGAVIAKLHVGDVKGARKVLDSLAKASDRPAGDMRSLLLASYVSVAERARGNMARR